jgi:alkylation response protein AidB-like acyl-CoA dehydrogenase
VDFSLTSEQLMLRDSASRYLEESYDFAQYHRSLAAEGHCDASVWRQFADLGWLGIGVPEALGGLGGDAIDAVIVNEALGAALVVEPYLSGALLPARLLLQLRSADLQREWLEALVAGKQQMAVAYAERDGRGDPGYCAVTARPAGDGYTLTGSKQCAFNAPNASHLIVSADRAPPDGEVSLFVVPVNSPGLTLESYPVMGGGVAANVRFDEVRVAPECEIEGGSDALEAGIDFAILADSAAALGAMEAVFRKTLDYVRTRKQFGAPLASYQVLQHRLAEMYLELEQSRSLILLAAMRTAAGTADERKLAVSSAKVYVGDASRLISQQAVQLHGGIGVTEELDVGHYFRRLTAYRLRHGDREFHLTRAMRYEPLN